MSGESHTIQKPLIISRFMGKNRLCEERWGERSFVVLFALNQRRKKQEVVRA